jgi:hypothetical protein
MNVEWIILRLLMDDVVSFDKSAIWRQAFLWFWEFESIVLGSCSDGKHDRSTTFHLDSDKNRFVSTTESCLPLHRSGIFDQGLLTTIVTRYTNLRRSTERVFCSWISLTLIEVDMLRLDITVLSAILSSALSTNPRGRLTSRSLTRFDLNHTWTS